MLRLFEDAFGVLWTRTSLTLGEITLKAIADRVLYVAAERWPVFSSLTIDSHGLVHDDPFRQCAATLQAAELTLAIRFVLVELLTVLGNLTADILTPELHAELATVTLESAAERADVEDTKP